VERRKKKEFDPRGALPGGEENCLFILTKGKAAAYSIVVEKGENKKEASSESAG